MKVLIVFLVFFTTIFSDIITLENQNLKVTIDKTSGLIMQISSSVNSQSGEFHKINCDGFVVQHFNVLTQTDSSLVLEITPNKTNLRGTVQYHLHEDFLEVSTTLSFKKTTELENGISVIFNGDFDSVYTSVPGYNKSGYSLDDSIDPIHLEPLTAFKKNDGSMTVLVRNPFHSFWHFNERRKGEHALFITPYTEPNGFEKEAGSGQGPLITSSFSPADTLKRSVEIYLSETDICPVVFSEHKNGAEASITMYWDELPGSQRKEGEWEFMTTADDTAAVEFDHFFLRLLEEHPKMVMGHLLLTDFIFDRPLSDFESWSVNSPFVLADSLYETEGEWCVNLYGEEVGTYKISQKVPCSENTNYILEYDMRTDSIEGGDGAYAEVYLNNPQKIIKGDQILGTTQWAKRRLEFQTTSDCDSILVYLRIENSKGLAFFDNVVLYQSGTRKNLLKNGGFESNKPQIVYDSSRRHFVDARGKLYVPNASVEFKRFLKRIETDSLKYGWENRMRLGSHGLHHTPSLSNPDSKKPGWEFQWYDPTGDSLRIDKIVENTLACGLTKKSLRFFRSAGFWYTKSLVDNLIRQDVVFLDASKKKNEHYSAFCQIDGKRIWLTSQTWWGDVRTSDDPELIFKRIKDGHLAHLGGHPYGMFKNRKEENYQRINQIFFQLEDSFPRLQYVYPDEYADYANALYDNQIVIKTQNCDDELVFQLYGSITEGTTLIIPGKCRSANFQGKELKLMMVKGRTLVKLPKCDSDSSTFTIRGYQPVLNHPKIASEKRATISFRQCEDHIYFDYPMDNMVSVEFFNPLGRKLLEKSLSLKDNKSVNIGKLSSGVVFMKITSNEVKTKTHKLLLK